jgi:hypothetical protein
MATKRDRYAVRRDPLYASSSDLPSLDSLSSQAIDESLRERFE